MPTSAARTRTAILLLLVLFFGITALGEGIALYFTSTAAKQNEAMLYEQRAFEAVQRLVIRNHGLVNKYLLTGDTRYVDTLRENQKALADVITEQRGSDRLNGNYRDKLAPITRIENEWSSRFAEPLIAARLSNDTGKGKTHTVAELQTLYLQSDPWNWDRRVNDALDDLRNAMRGDRTAYGR